VTVLPEKRESSSKNSSSISPVSLALLMDSLAGERLAAAGESELTDSQPATNRPSRNERVNEP